VRGRGVPDAVDLRVRPGAQGSVHEHPAAIVHRQSGLARQRRHREAGGPRHRVGGDVLAVRQPQAGGVDLGDRGVFQHVDAEPVEGPVQILLAGYGQRRAHRSAGDQPHGAVGVGLGEPGRRLQAGRPGADHGDRARS
jgi:hypothetical protein